MRFMDMLVLLPFVLLTWTVDASNTPLTQWQPFSITRFPRSTFSDTPRYTGQTVIEIPVIDVQPNEHDRIQVISSAIRVLPREKKRYKRADPQWRTPKAHKFVTAKVEKIDPPSVIRVYPIDRTQRYLNNGYYNYRRTPPRRRIIYYATLPEIVHSPSPWQQSQNERMYLPPRTNEINRFPSGNDDIYRLPPRTPDVNRFQTGNDDMNRLPSRIYEMNRFQSGTNDITRLPPRGNEITRVQSNLIDVVNTRHTPKYTIIDVEPPYNYANSDKDRYYNDIRTPPYRNPVPSYIPEENLKPVKLQIPTSVNATEASVNNTRLLPEDLARFV